MIQHLKLAVHYDYPMKWLNHNLSKAFMTYRLNVSLLRLQSKTDCMPADSSTGQQTRSQRLRMFTRLKEGTQ